MDAWTISPPYLHGTEANERYFKAQQAKNLTQSEIKKVNVEDIQRYQRAHSQDIKCVSQDELANKAASQTKTTAPKSKKNPTAKKPATKAVPKKATAKKAAVKKKS